MLIDWVTCRIPLDLVSHEAREAALKLGDRITRYCPHTGDIRHTTVAWDSIRSDSHQINVRAASDLWIQGSPARLMGNGCTVFGSGASSALDLIGCVTRMINFVSGPSGLSTPLPDYNSWKVSRVDVTDNLYMESLTNVFTALNYLKSTEGGRYRVTAKSGATCYWNHGSKLRKGKAYAKGPHLRHLQRQKTYTGHEHTIENTLYADSLLRLELTLAREFFSRNDWKSLTPEQLTTQWKDYFLRMIGDADMPTDNNELRLLIEKNAPTKGQAKSAFMQWTSIQQNGWEITRDMTSSSTWYRNLKILRASGLSDTDISHGQVIPLRRNILTAQPVNNWAELYSLSA